MFMSSLSLPSQLPPYPALVAIQLATFSRWHNPPAASSVNQDGPPHFIPLPSFGL